MASKKKTDEKKPKSSSKTDAMRAQRERMVEEQRERADAARRARAKSK